MKVIFLDLDGVLNSTRSRLATKDKLGSFEYSPDDPNVYFWNSTLSTIDPIAVSLLNRAVKETKAKIVISSSHRNHFKESPFKLSELKNYFHRLGVDSEHIISYTPSLVPTRGIEIQAWLDKYDEPINYAILDDDDDMLANQQPFFIKTNGKVGLSSDDYYKILGLLK